MAQFTSLRISDAQGRNRTLYIDAELAKVASRQIAPGRGVAHDAGQNGMRTLHAGNSARRQPGRELIGSTLSGQAYPEKRAQHAWRSAKPEENMRKKALKQRFELPPVPAENILAFDARFEDNTSISELAQATIHIRATDFPLLIRASNLYNPPARNQAAGSHKPGREDSDSVSIADIRAAGDEDVRYAISEMIGSEEVRRHTLKESEIITISDSRVSALKLTREAAVLPETFALAQNFPNPFNPVTEIRFALATDSRVELNIYNLLGQKIKTLAAAQMAMGKHSVVWDATNDQGNPVASGMYVYRLVSGPNRAVKKMILLR